MGNLSRILLSMLFCLIPAAVLAGDLDAPAAPTAAGSSMYTLDDIYNRLHTGTAGAKRSGAFTEPTSGPGSTGHTLNQVMAVSPSVADAAGAGVAEVLTGKTFWGLKSVGWGVLTGTMPTNTLTDANDTVSAGYYGATTLRAVDSDLTAGNIKDSVTIFGITGNYSPSACDCSSGTLSGTRWCDNGDGTVTDLTTCIVWLKKADWGDLKRWNDQLGNDDANTRAGILSAGTAGANLSDGSGIGIWRLPTYGELWSLIGGNEWVSSDTPRAFTGVQPYGYWTSTTVTDDTSRAWSVDLYRRNSREGPKVGDNYVWPVHGRR